MIPPSTESQRARGLVSRLAHLTQQCSQRIVNLRWLGITYDVADDVVIVPVKKWHAVIDERNSLRRRCAQLEAALAAVEQGQ